MMGNINPKDSYDEVKVRKEKVGDIHEKLNKSKSKRDEFEVTEEMKDEDVEGRGMRVAKMRNLEKQRARQEK
jgi:hypothetical protein